MLQDFFAKFSEKLKVVFEPILKAFRTVFDWVKSVFEGIVSAIEFVFAPITESFHFIFGEEGIVFQVFSKVKGFFDNIIEGFKKAWDGLKNVFVWVNDNIFQPIKDFFQGIIDAFKDVINGIGDAVGGVGDFFGGIGDAVGGVVGSVGDFFGFSQGGLVGGSPTSGKDSPKNDVYPAMLSQGEMVVPRSAVNGGLGDIMRFASNLLGEKPKALAYGGMVEGVKPSYRAQQYDAGGASLGNELSQLRAELKQMMFSVASNGQKIERILTQWDGEGLPSDRGF